MSKNLQTKKYQDLIYDVGMHKGEDTEYYLIKGFRVIGFEADPDLVAHCRARFSNEISNGQVVIVEGAITEKSHIDNGNTTISFYKNKDNTQWGTVVQEWAQRNENLGATNEVLSVPSVDFTEYLKKYGIPHYLKIDIEGMDKVCLKALIDFEQKPDYISLESEKILFNNLIEEFNLLQQLGYNNFKAVQQSDNSKYNKSRKGPSSLFGEDLSGEWKDIKHILSEYKTIFNKYKFFGDYGILKNYFIGKLFISFYKKILGSNLPGWYDTHAKHSSLDS